MAEICPISRSMEENLALFMADQGTFFVYASDEGFEQTRDTLGIPVYRSYGEIDAALAALQRLIDRNECRKVVYYAEEGTEPIFYHAHVDKDVLRYITECLRYMAPTQEGSRDLDVYKMHPELEGTYGYTARTFDSDELNTYMRTIYGDSWIGV